jgi:alkanesulfonate monooxygenase SsuD/methylene tetrahydromethanopterin reductase-like flavin-dependent oxidoreductase (luciferase family)
MVGFGTRCGRSPCSPGPRGPGRDDRAASVGHVPAVSQQGKEARDGTRADDVYRQPWLGLVGEGMQIGIGLPSLSPVSGTVILEWARRADAGRFSSLGMIDRLVGPNYEPLVALAAAAAITHRIGLMTSVILAPLHNAGVLAKQAASLDALSGGRLSLGLGVGGREDDFRAAPASFADRGKRFEEQLALMKRIWSGQPPAEDIDPIGPPPVRRGGPEILIGGGTPVAIRRVGRWADGYNAGGWTNNPTRARRLYDIAEEA